MNGLVNIKKFNNPPKKKKGLVYKYKIFQQQNTIYEYFVYTLKKTDSSFYTVCEIYNEDLIKQSEYSYYSDDDYYKLLSIKTYDSNGEIIKMNTVSPTEMPMKIKNVDSFSFHFTFSGISDHKKIEIIRDEEIKYDSLFCQVNFKNAKIKSIKRYATMTSIYKEGNNNEPIKSKWHTIEWFSKDIGLFKINIYDSSKKIIQKRQLEKIIKYKDWAKLKNN